MQYSNNHVTFVESTIHDSRYRASSCPLNELPGVDPGLTVGPRGVTAVYLGHLVPAHARARNHKFT